MHLLRWTAAVLAVLGTTLAACTTGASSTTTVASEFAGSAKCGTCHQAEYKAWKDSYHAKTVRSPQQDLWHDAVDHWTNDARGNAGPTTGNIDGRSYALADVEMVVGSKWKQRYLVKNPVTGNHQFLDKQWNRYLKVWEPYGQKNDWEAQCDNCHAGGGRVPSYELKQPTAMRAAVTEKNVGCEACHGPGARHAASGDKADLINAGPTAAEKRCSP